MNDQANNISDKIHMYQYQLESISTSKRASIEPNAQAIHHRTMLHAIDQKMIDVIKLSRENRIFASSSLCIMAISRGIHRATIIMIQK